MFHSRWVLRWLGAAALGCCPTVTMGQESLGKTVAFNRDIRPILSDKCYPCHGPDSGRRKANLRLDRREEAIKEHNGHRAIVPGEPDESDLVFRVEDADPTVRMPPPATGASLDTAKTSLLRRWIAQGARYEAHWSFSPPGRPAVPEVADRAWPLVSADRFILAKLEAAGLRPSPEADQATLIRRLTFDLTGLPPTPEEVDAYLADLGPDAYARLVERLLDSPHFGERMAIFWLDLVRYADTVGYHGDQEHHVAPYRDWVIRSFNANLPFDRFTTEQLAGDLLPGSGNDGLVASAYNRLLQTTHEGGAQDGEYRAKYAADRVRNLSAVWLGATIGCAECHDHKFDPYTQRDFYSLAAFFADVEERGAYPGPDKSPTAREPEREVLNPEDLFELEKIDAELAALTGALDAVAPADPVSEALGMDLRAWSRSRDEVRGRARRTMITVAVEPRMTRVLRRGDWMDDGGPVVAPAVPAALGRLEVTGRRATRLDLARWLTKPENPLVARVFVNRLWALFIGEGLARTLDDNGAQGAWPTHPELLDWLAVDFAESGWDVKRAIRQVVSSRTYRQSSAISATLRERDPENQLFARQGRSRLPAEMIRDNALAISGLLVRRFGGPNARPYQPAGYYAPLNFPKREYRADADENQYRRGVYMHWQRQFLHPMLRAFDAPSREECTTRRPVSNTPLAALALLNDPTFVEAARAFAARIVREGGSTPAERASWAWRVALARRAEQREVAALVRHYEQGRVHYAAHPEAAEALLRVGLAPQPKGVDPVELAAWSAVARAMLNLHETITKE